MAKRLSQSSPVPAGFAVVGAYALAAARAVPHAVQVAGRWHLMENTSRAFLDAVRKSMRQIRSAIGAMTINPDLLSAAERLQYEGYLRREEANAAVFALAKDGVAIKEIVRSTGHCRGLGRIDIQFIQIMDAARNAKPLEVDGAAFIAGGEAAEVLEPVEASLDAVALLVGDLVVRDEDLACTVGGDDGLSAHLGDDFS